MYGSLRHDRIVDMRCVSRDVQMPAVIMENIMPNILAARGSGCRKISLVSSCRSAIVDQCAEAVVVEIRLPTMALGDGI